MGALFFLFINVSVSCIDQTTDSYEVNINLNIDLNSSLSLVLFQTLL